MKHGMFGKDWRASPAAHDVFVEQDFQIPVDDEITLVGNLFRPDTEDPTPLLAGFHPYNTEFQSAPIKPKAVGSQLAWAEGGDPRFFAKRGYAHALINVRGTGKSSGEFRNMGPREVDDVVTALEWLAERDWCDGNIGMMGLAYFGALTKRVAARDVPSLEAIFAPWSFTDPYRDLYYHGGILAKDYLLEFCDHLDNPRCHSWSHENLGTDEFNTAISDAVASEEIYAVEPLANALENPTDGVNPLLVDVILNGLNGEGEYFTERRLSYEGTTIPAYLGADWGHHAGHLSAAFRSWRQWKGVKKLLIGPDMYLDRPFYQLHDEALRWFDYWLKDRPTGICDEPTLRLFDRGGDAGWKTPSEWPLPSTRWTPFQLHERGILLDRDHWPNEGYTTFEESPFRHEGLEFVSPPLVERTEVFGPPKLTLHASTTDTDLLLFISLLAIDDGERKVLTRGWLRGSQSTVADSEKPWRVEHTHEDREPLTPESVYRFEVGLCETGYTFTPGERLGLRIASTGGGRIHWVGEQMESLPTDETSGYVSSGHLSRQTAARITIRHNDSYPSTLYLPVTSGNILGTFYSGGESDGASYGHFPKRKVQMDK
jgi:predicted acyl esterase